MSRRMGGAFGTRSKRRAPAIRRDARPQDLRDRLSAYAALMLFVLLVLLGRLWVLQVVRGEEYAAQAQSNHLKQREIPAPRGSIYDADGHRLAEVRASFDLVVQPREVDPGPAPAKRIPRSSMPGADDGIGGEADQDAAAGLRGGPLLDDLWTIEERTDIVTLCERLAALLDDVTVGELLERWDEARKISRHRQVVLAPDVSFEELERVMASRPRLPGLSVASRHRRSYSDPELFAHLLGYQREVRADDLKRLREKYKDTEHGEDWYESGDLIGRFGIEGGWEKWLRGTDGAFWVQVDALGRQLGRSADPNQPGAEYFRSIAHFLDEEVIPEVPGHDLHLTVRRDLQELGYSLLGEESGAVAMLEVNTGRVLALVNAPSFDPSIFSRRLPPHLWNELNNDPKRPMVDKALTGIYPPGSTWKMIVAAAALGSGTWNKDTTVTCNGGHRIGRARGIRLHHAALRSDHEGSGAEGVAAHRQQAVECACEVELIGGVLNGGPSIGGERGGGAHHRDVLSGPARGRQLHGPVLAVDLLDGLRHALDVVGGTAGCPRQSEAPPGLPDVAQLQSGLRAECMLLKCQLHALGFEAPKPRVDAFDPFPRVAAGQLAEVLVEPHELRLLRGAGVPDRRGGQADCDEHRGDNHPVGAPPRRGPTGSRAHGRSTTLCLFRTEKGHPGFRTGHGNNPRRRIMTRA